MRLPNGMGTLTFTGYRQWISLAITYDPGQLPALIAAIAALAGLLISFLVRRRRVFLRAVPAAGGGSTVEFAGLARTESSETFGAEFAELSTGLSAALMGETVPATAGELGPHGDSPAGTAPAAGERGPHGNVPVGKTPSGTSPATHAGASAVPTGAPDALTSAASGALSSDVPSETDERE
jgi:hypothetical protein